MKVLTIKTILLAIVMTIPSLIFANQELSDKTVSLNKENATIKEVLKEITNQTGYTFIYSSSEFNDKNPISIVSENQRLNKVLDRILEGLNTTYQLRGKEIAILKEENKKIDIKGFVKDNTGIGMPGVNVIQKGTTNGTVTDVQGRFVLTIVNPSTQILEVSSIGYATQDIKIGNKTQLEIILSEDAVGLDEVVVVGYGTQKKVNLSGAVTSVKGDVLKNRPITNIAQGLQGTMPGLRISGGNFAPGQSPSFNIRGMTSLNGGSPLVLVDGVSQDPRLLNPEDIESISVLKDAASAAVYGSRAAFGVVLITTKKGKKNEKTQVQISTSYTVNELSNKIQYADGWEYVTYMNQANKNRGNGNYFSDRIINGVWEHYTDPTKPSVLYDPAIDTDGKYKYVGNTDWFEELYEPSNLLTNSINVSGGTEKTKYFMSYGNMKHKGFLAIYDDTYERNTVNLSVDTDLEDWVTLSGNIKYANTHYDLPTSGWKNTGLSYGNGLAKSDLRPIMPVAHPNGDWSGQGSFTNPFAIGDKGGSDKRDENDLFITGGFDIHPIDGLHLKANYTWNTYSYNRRRHIKQIREGRAKGFGYYPWTNPSGTAKYNSYDKYRALNVLGNYTKTLFEKNNFDLLVGYNQEEKYTSNFWAQRKGLILHDMPFLSRASGEKEMGDGASSWALEGIFGSFKYNFDEKYYLEINGRYDGSSKFPDGDRYAFFPSVSTAWTVSKEQFFSPLIDIMNFFKLRISYGTLGNQNVSGDFPYLSDYSTGDASRIIGSAKPKRVYVGGLVSDSFTWESVEQKNLGFDFGFLKNSLSGSFDVYRRDTKDMLTGGQPLPSTLGTGVPRENAADLKTIGWEFQVNYKNSIDDFNYSISFNIENSRSYITKYETADGKTSIGGNYVGREQGEMWGFESDGLFQTVEEIASHADQSDISGSQWNPGDVKYNDINGDGKITYGESTLESPGDRKIIGNSNAQYLYGFTFNADWKGIDISAFFQGVGSKDVWVDSRLFGINDEWGVPMDGALDFWHDGIENPVTGEVSEPNHGAYLPRIYISGNGKNRQTSTRYLQDGSYLRLKQLTLGYTIPKEISKMALIESFRVYFTAQNLWTLTDMNEMFDPEQTSVQGYPVPKSFSFGLNLTF